MQPVLLDSDELYDVPSHFLILYYSSHIIHFYPRQTGKRIWKEAEESDVIARTDTFLLCTMIILSLTVLLLIKGYVRT